MWRGGEKLLGSGYRTGFGDESGGDMYVPVYRKYKVPYLIDDDGDDDGDDDDGDDDGKKSLMIMDEVVARH